jgi:hypothetical protein
VSRLASSQASPQMRPCKKPEFQTATPPLICAAAALGPGTGSLGFGFGGSLPRLGAISGRCILAALRARSRSPSLHQDLRWAGLRNNLHSP